MKLYHTTHQNRVEQILKQGLKINSEPNYSIGSLEYSKEIYGVYPIFLKQYKNSYDNDSEETIELEIDSSGLELLADIPTLLSNYRANLSDDTIWWKDGTQPDIFREDTEILISDLLDPDSQYCRDAIYLTETCAVLQNISPDRITVLENMKENLRKFIKEEIKLDISKGDIILGGRFKNKRIVIKSIGKDELGQPTINGKPILKFRIEKELPKEKQSKQSREQLKEFIINEIELILSESVQSIVNLQYPDIIASMLYDKFGKNTYLIAKWLKEYHSYKFQSRDGTQTNFPGDWFIRSVGDSFFSKRYDSLGTYMQLYDAAKISKEEYNRVSDENDLSGFKEDEYFDQADVVNEIKEAVKGKFFEDIFFKSTLIQDIMNGKITDLAPYKNSSFGDAKDKYDKKRMFKDTPALKTYDNGWKWVNAGEKCQLVGGLMKNCGSTGVMSWDKDRTMLTLFDKGNKPHVVATFSPNEKRISGVEGVAGSEPKEKYHDYVLDIAEFLGADFDEEKSKSSSLRLKSILKNIPHTLEVVSSGSYNDYYKVTLKDGSEYYTDTKEFIDAEKTDEIINKEFNGNLVANLPKILRDSRPYEKDGLVGIYFTDFKTGKR